jgi:hypothetical protein
MPSKAGADEEAYQPDKVRLPYAHLQQRHPSRTLPTKFGLVRLDLRLSAAFAMAGMLKAAKRDRI